MKMGDLGYGQHCQQEQAENCHGRQKAGRDATLCAISGAAFAAENCGESRHGPVNLNPCLATFNFHSTESLQKFGRDEPGEVVLKLRFRRCARENGSVAGTSKLGCHGSFSASSA
jgi:hypothetical protein